LLIFLTGIMRKPFLNFSLFVTVFSLFISVPVLADKPSWAGNHKDGEHGRYGGKDRGNGKNNKDYQRHQDNQGGNWNYQRDYQGGSRNYRNGNYAAYSFDNRQRTVIYDYFGPRFRSGRCPPGLAKKQNGCLPPGQAKQWRMGYPLPQHIIFYNLPSALIGQLGYPGPGYRYVRVAADILLIAIGTGLVVDAIEDLNTL
jgi:Ni/Co efflux regulator RcnB